MSSIIPHPLLPLIRSLKGGLEWLMETGHTDLPLDPQHEFFQYTPQFDPEKSPLPLPSSPHPPPIQHVSRSPSMPIPTSTSISTPTSASQPSLPLTPLSTDPVPLKLFPAVEMDHQVWNTPFIQNSFKDPPPTLRKKPKHCVDMITPISAVALRLKALNGDTQESTDFDAPVAPESSDLQIDSPPPSPSATPAPSPSQQLWVNQPQTSSTDPSSTLASPSPNSQEDSHISEQKRRQVFVDVEDQEAIPHPFTRGKVTLPIVGDALATAWETLNASILECKLCNRCENRFELILGSGLRSASIMVVYSHPDEIANQTGHLFSDPITGEKFTRMMHVLNPSRHQVYTTALLKCNSRSPLPQEWVQCRTHFLQELDLVRPSYLLVLGQMACQILFSDLGLPPKRSQWRLYQGIPLIATYSPSELIRGQEVGRRCYDDLRSLIRRINKEKELSQEDLEEVRKGEIRTQELEIARLNQERAQF